MRLRSAAPCVVIAAALLVAGVDYSAPGARLDPDPHNLDLLASAQPTTDQPAERASRKKYPDAQPASSTLPTGVAANCFTIPRCRAAVAMRPAVSDS